MLPHYSQQALLPSVTWKVSEMLVFRGDSHNFNFKTMAHGEHNPRLYAGKPN